MKKICIYTCITGNYDNIHEVEIIDNDVDFICYTNNKNIKSKTWKVIYVENDGLNDHQLSRKIKMLGTDYINNKYDISVWQDASVIWDKKPSVFVKKYLKNNSFAAFKHAYRDCIYDEAIEVIRLRKENKEKVIETIKFLKNEQFPAHIGLYEMTVFIKKNNDLKLKETMELWFKTYCEHSKRDQMSFMYSVWKTGLKIDNINLNVWNNEWVHHARHNAKKELTDCRIYFGDSNLDTSYDYNLDHVYKYKIKNNEYTIEATIPKDTNVIEIDMTDVPCVVYDDFKISIKCDNVYFFNTIEYGGKNIFYNDHGIVRLEGKFRKKDKLKISVRFDILSEIDKNLFINQLSNDLIILSEDNNNIKNELEELSKIKKTIFYKLYIRELRIKNRIKRKK